MPIIPPNLRNDSAITQTTRVSQVTAEDFASRVGRARTNVDQAIRQYKDNSSAVGMIRFPSSEVAKYYTVLQISDYQRTDLFNVDFKTNNSIVLPLPRELVKTDTVSYEEAEVGMVTGVAANALGKNIPTNVQNLGALRDRLSQMSSSIGSQLANGQYPKELTNDLSTFQNIGSAIALEAGQILAPKGVENATQAFAGYSPNQFFTVLLKGPDYTKYTFSWQFLPKNFQESQTIAKIYNGVMNAKAPTAAIGGALWKFPSMFRLAFMPNSMYMFKFKPAVCTAASFDFSSGGQIPAFYNSTAPESVTMTLSFTEIEYWLGSDYKLNNDPYDTEGPARGV